jgi:hypothetical protein
MTYEPTAKKNIDIQVGGSHRKYSVTNFDIKACNMHYFITFS